MKKDKLIGWSLVVGYLIALFSFYGYKATTKIKQPVIDLPEEWSIADSSNCLGIHVTKDTTFIYFKNKNHVTKE